MLNNLPNPYPNNNDALEKIPCHIFTNSHQASSYVVQVIIETIHNCLQSQGYCRLALPTGNTPIETYTLLVQSYNEGKVSFKNTEIFLLDEYYPIEPEDECSFHYFINYHLIRHIDLPKENFHFLQGNIAREQINNHTANYEANIRAKGGIDLMILGIGQNGHIGFNEPGTHINSVTRKVVLSPQTRVVNAPPFAQRSVPYTAMSIGLQTILHSKKILLMAWGEHKAPVIQQTLEGSVCQEIPASILQLHHNTTFVLDALSSAKLSRFIAPWQGGRCDWDLKMSKKAVISLALQLNKPILNLTEKDYLDHGLRDLLLVKKGAYQANLEVFYALRDSITGWPGGKPSPLPNHPEREHPYPKRILIFSPHPDDDIISMGGTMMRLQDQGHEVHVAYQTSGNIAVKDEFVERFLNFARELPQIFQRSNFPEEITNISQLNRQDILALKALIRRCEAIATCKYVGIPMQQVHFQNLPFYETGEIAKKPIGADDLQATISLIEQIQPHQIYCAGDFSDPHGTHKICTNLILQALQSLVDKDQNWLTNTWVWLYRGAWQEWDISEIDMAIPMSPDQVRKKRHGIFMHQSQKDIIPFQGDDQREFWQRTEERNYNTANLYSSLGLTHYRAIEAFKRCIL